VIAEKLNERSKGSLAFTRMFNQFDTDKSGFIDRTGIIPTTLSPYFPLYFNTLCLFSVDTAILL